jgi:hypothetical protein
LAGHWSIKTGWFKRLPFFIVLLFILSSCTATEPDQVRISQIVSMLDENPIGFGASINDRQTWDHLSQDIRFSTFISQAESELKTPIPALTDSLFFIYSKTGVRYKYQNPMNKRRSALETLTLAECLQNDGRYLVAIEKYLGAICSEVTWVYPAHDKKLDNFYGRIKEIDLSSALTSLRLGTVAHLLGDRLSEHSRNLVIENITHRVFEPYLTRLNSNNPFGWMTATHNWNSVCHAGVVGAALALLSDPNERALFIYGAEKYSPFYLSGFGDDGYCSEGLSYWNYGFGNYLQLAMAVEHATKGNIDLLTGSKWRKVAAFPLNLEMRDGVYPAFADCPVFIQPKARYMRELNRRFQFGDNRWESVDLSLGGSLYEIAAFEGDQFFADVESGIKKEHSGSHWFYDAGVLVSRADDPSGLSVALKGGHNDEHHNHNDVGSFVVACGKSRLLLDPGNERYSARTFSSKRYDSNVLNSFGHPVPRIGGDLQKSGAEACAIVIKQSSSSDADTLVLELSSAYDVESLKRLERTFVFSRKGGGRLEVVDRAEFSEPTPFELALITFDEFEEVNEKRLIVSDGENALTVVIDAGVHVFEISSQQIKEDVPIETLPTRIGAGLVDPVVHAVVKMIISPVVQK